MAERGEPNRRGRRGQGGVGRRDGWEVGRDETKRGIRPACVQLGSALWFSRFSLTTFFTFTAPPSPLFSFFMPPPTFAGRSGGQPPARPPCLEPCRLVQAAGSRAVPCRFPLQSVVSLSQSQSAEVFVGEGSVDVSALALRERAYSNLLLKKCGDCLHLVVASFPTPGRIFHWLRCGSSVSAVVSSKCWCLVCECDLRSKKSVCD